MVWLFGILVWLFGILIWLFGIFLSFVFCPLWGSTKGGGVVLGSVMLFTRDYMFSVLA